MARRSDEIYTFEPGAATPLLFSSEVEGDTPFNPTGVSLKVSVTIKKVRYDLIGVWEAENAGFAVDLNDLKDVITNSNLISGYVYMTSDDVWERVATVYLQPIEGAEWQPTT